MFEEPKPYRTDKLTLGTYEYRKIKAWQTNGNIKYKQGTTAGERIVTEKRFIPKDGSPVQYTNYW